MEFQKKTLEVFLTMNLFILICILLLWKMTVENNFCSKKNRNGYIFSFSVANSRGGKLNFFGSKRIRSVYHTETTSRL